MKILPSVNPAVPLAIGTSKSAPDSVIAFKELLAPSAMQSVARQARRETSKPDIGAGAGGVSDDHAFAFSALGVFGGHGEGAPTQSPPDHLNQLGQVEAGESGGAPTLLALLADASALPPGMTTTLVGALADGVGNDEFVNGSSEAVGSHDGQPTVVSMFRNAPAPALSEDPEAPTVSSSMESYSTNQIKAPAPLRDVANSTAPLSVILVKTPGGLAVVSASQDLTAEARARFQSLALEAGSELGVTLTEVQHNGQLLARRASARNGADK